MHNPILKASRKIESYRNWQAYNQALVVERKSFSRLLFELCKFVPEFVRNPGAGRSRLPLREMVFVLILRTYCCTSSRRFVSEMAGLKEQGYVREIPHFNTISRYLALPELHPILKSLLTISSSPLEELEDEFAVDSSGFSTGQYFDWRSTKYGPPSDIRKAAWLKCHLTCGIMSHIVTAVQITDRCVSDHGQFIPLIEETSRHFQIKRVMADKAYLSAVNLRFVDDKGGVAFIPFKKNSRLGKANRDSVWQTLYWFFHLQNEQFRKFYGRRANVECTFSMIKRKFGERLRSKSVTAQMNEILCKILCHNICCVIQAKHRMKIKPDFHKDARHVR